MWCGGVWRDRTSRITPLLELLRLYFPRRSGPRLTEGNLGLEQEGFFATTLESLLASTRLFAYFFEPVKGEDAVLWRSVEWRVRHLPLKRGVLLYGWGGLEV